MVFSFLNQPEKRRETFSGTTLAGCAAGCRSFPDILGLTAGPPRRSSNSLAVRATGAPRATVRERKDALPSFDPRSAGERRATVLLLSSGSNINACKRPRRGKLTNCERSLSFYGKQTVNGWRFASPKRRKSGISNRSLSFTG
ncbi:hypothetical protein OE766_10680 [Pararhizobium sp. YC-54]|uniref:hypothetical protein n=1 Tax=Pararhizobium sp. YC-54 TaxID=2986920 RepID=UPI0021F6EB44|nr:hypothetical protein [Pararhizobium sp. YC-54]MCV9998713.1 hypothetical protein [Pararhizobium sp. YC-54]